MADDKIKKLFVDMEVANLVGILYIQMLELSKGEDASTQ